MDNVFKTLKCICGGLGQGWEWVNFPHAMTLANRNSAIYCTSIKGAAALKLSVSNRTEIIILVIFVQLFFTNIVSEHQSHDMTPLKEQFTEN